MSKLEVAGRFEDAVAEPQFLQAALHFVDRFLELSEESSHHSILRARAVLVSWSFESVRLPMAVGARTELYKALAPANTLCFYA